MEFFFGETKGCNILFGTWKALFFCKSNFCVAKQSNHFLGGIKKLLHCMFFCLRNFILSEPSFFFWQICSKGAFV